jgi:two-component sensor histidine kinase
MKASRPKCSTFSASWTERRAVARADPYLTDPAAVRDPVRIATGVKMFLILVVALFPLGMIALIATLQSTRTVDVERRALLRVAATESARALSIELVGDMAALRTAANAIAANPNDSAICGQVAAILAIQNTRRIRFGIGPTGEPAFCGHRVPPLFAKGTPPDDKTAVRLLPDRGIMLGVRSDDGRISGRAFFPRELLADLGRPSNFMAGYSLAMTADGAALPLYQSADTRLLEQVDRLAAPTGIEGLGIEMSLSRAPLSAPEIVSIIAPLLMWIAAALIAWLVTDRLLLAPLKRLRRDLVAYTPGESFTLSPDSRTPAVELQELGETFRRITTIVTEHEAGLARGLEHQTRLTREVHHRVKNNLQVIASLINLHARGAKGAEAVRAYASIQRRVDALSVVHRNHFAEMEVNRGLNLRSVIGELASNIRATAPEKSGRMQIALELEPIYVTQDTAVAIAFLVTELVEITMTMSPTAILTITAVGTGNPGRAILSVQSSALQDSSRLRRAIAGSVARVTEGLARQLRSPLLYDGEAGSFSVEIAYVARD